MSISLHQKYYLGLDILRSWVQTIQTMYPSYEYIKTSVNITTPKISLEFEHLRSWVRTLYPSYVYTFVLLEGAVGSNLVPFLLKKDLFVF